jgi:hypothetical protein
MSEASNRSGYWSAASQFEHGLRSSIALATMRTHFPFAQQPERLQRSTDSGASHRRDSLD